MLVVRSRYAVVLVVLIFGRLDGLKVEGKMATGHKTGGRVAGAGVTVPHPSQDGIVRFDVTVVRQTNVLHCGEPLTDWTWSTNSSFTGASTPWNC
jgi:hypothetical protein